MYIDRLAMLQVDASALVVRPDSVPYAFIIHWEDEDIIIPWLKGESPRVAIIRWARKQENGEL